MVLPLALRTLLLLAAGGLAACAGSPPPSALRMVEGELTALTLQSRSGPALALQNESAMQAEKIYSESTNQLLKVVPDQELEGLFRVFTVEELFPLALPRVPADARDVLRLDHAGRTWFWVRRGSFTDPREAAFVQARAYFLALYNGNTAYHSDDRSSFRDAARDARRKGSQAIDKLEGRGR